MDGIEHHHWQLWLAANVANARHQMVQQWLHRWSPKCVGSATAGAPAKHSQLCQRCQCSTPDGAAMAAPAVAEMCTAGAPAKHLQLLLQVLVLYAIHVDGIEHKHWEHWRQPTFPTLNLWLHQWLPNSVSSATAGAPALWGLQSSPQSMVTAPPQCGGCRHNASLLPAHTGFKSRSNLELKPEPEES
ncbi:hypothetical protein K439DRAFT_1615667 [Ramaria rubella]|nr:hypothetical protein K439DRAFT_1615667 [Ramaria rubella]